METERPVGRPTVMTDETLSKLEEAFLNGASDKEACFIANISTQSLYDYQKLNPEYAERKEGLKDMPKYQAKKNIVEAIKDKNLTTSQWYAERKIKDEFAVRSELSGTGGKDLIPQPELSDEQYNRIIRTRAEKLNSAESV